ncbi:tetratricopeptide repeat protein [Streptomyces sp. NPDC085540]|uniref:tetratricopeptide repeat protein n=1 Tax=Streptomyces sp. NPDC085540 TaxID=3365730 RepID=UPI0037D6AADE
MAVGYVAAGGHVTYFAAPRPAVTWPHQVGVAPNPAKCFQHRAAAVQLQQALAGGGTAVLGQVLAGMGGVGKTQLAAQYARNAQSTGAVDLVVWVTAATRQGIVDAYAEAAAEVLGASGVADQAATAFLAFLDRDRAVRWLVVLDDVAVAADLTGLWPPDSPNGHTLITTRNRDAALLDGRRLVDVGLFTEAESKAYLTAKLASFRRQDDPREVAALADDLGHLPLALAQAVPYMANRRLTCSAYRARLADRRRTLPTLLADINGLPDDQRLTVAAAWSLSIDLADELHPQGLARPLLRLAAWLDPNGIPSSVLTSEPAHTYLNARAGTEPETGTAGETDDINDALWNLHQLSLIDYTPSTPHQAVRVHQLIQRAVREGLRTGTCERIVRTAADALTDVWPENERDVLLARVLRANAAALLQHPGPALYLPQAHAMLFRMGTSMGECGQVSGALAHFRAFADAAGDHLGADHIQTMWARGNMARWLGETGDAAGAAAEFESLLDRRRRVLGPDDPETLSAQARFARWLAESGDRRRAIEIIRALLLVQSAVLGPDHPETLSARANLANWQGQEGDAAGAVSATRVLLADRVRVLGPDHALTLLTRANLAYWQKEAGDEASATARYELVLADQERLLGQDHPAVFLTRSNIALARGEAGDAAGASAALDELLQHMLRVLEPDHLDTLAVRRNLAHWRTRSGDAAGAAAAFEELSAAQERVLGSRHARTRESRHQAAACMMEAGDPAGAMAAYERWLADYEPVLGPDHADVFITRTNLADAQGEAGDAAGASAALDALLQHVLLVVEADSPHILAVRWFLAHWRGRAGDAAGAAAAFEELSAARERVLGPLDPLTVDALSGTALWRAEAGDFDAAAQTYRVCVKRSLRVWGPDHENTLTARTDLAEALRGTARTAETAEAFFALHRARRRVLGPDHPDSVQAHMGAAAYSRAAGDSARARAAYRAIEEQLTRLLGPTHPVVITTREILGAPWTQSPEQTTDLTPE